MPWLRWKGDGGALSTIKYRDPHTRKIVTAYPGDPCFMAEGDATVRRFPAFFGTLGSSPANGDDALGNALELAYPAKRKLVAELGLKPPSHKKAALDEALRAHFGG